MREPKAFNNSIPTAEYRTTKAYANNEHSFDSIYRRGYRDGALSVLDLLLTGESIQDVRSFIDNAIKQWASEDVAYRAADNGWTPPMPPTYRKGNKGIARA